MSDLKTSIFDAGLVPLEEERKSQHKAIITTDSRKKTDRRRNGDRRKEIRFEDNRRQGDSRRKSRAWEDNNNL